MTGFHPAGFPHSDIHGSKLVSSSPRLIAAYNVLHRLLVPRHPPYALSSLTFKFFFIFGANKRTASEKKTLGYRLLSDFICFYPIRLSKSYCLKLYLSLKEALKSIFTGVAD